jgi:hypothetical protein
MPRRSLADEYYEGVGDLEGEGGHWIIIYDFEGKPNPRFWTNMHKLSAYHTASGFLQYSVYSTSSRRVARVAVMLARHYGGTVEVFKGESIEP